MKLLLACYLLYLALRLFLESLYTYKKILDSEYNTFKTLKSPILKFVFSMTLISIIYFILQYRWIHSGTYNSIDDSDQLLWSLSEGLMLFTFTNICTLLRRL